MKILSSDRGWYPRTYFGDCVGSHDLILIRIKSNKKLLSFDYHNFTTSRHWGSVPQLRNKMTLLEHPALFSSTIYTRGGVSGKFGHKKLHVWKVSETELCKEDIHGIQNPTNTVIRIIMHLGYALAEVEKEPQTHTPSFCCRRVRYPDTFLRPLKTSRHILLQYMTCWGFSMGKTPANPVGWRSCEGFGKQDPYFGRGFDAQLV